MPRPLPGEVEEAKRNPNGWVYRIQGTFGPDEAVPPEAIVGAWKVDGKGKIVGEFTANSKFSGVEKKRKSWLPWKR